MTARNLDAAIASDTRYLAWWAERRARRVALGLPAEPAGELDAAQAPDEEDKDEAAEAAEAAEDLDATVARTAPTARRPGTRREPRAARLPATFAGRRASSEAHVVASGGAASLRSRCGSVRWRAEVLVPAPKGRTPCAKCGGGGEP